jgi:hypothetical protein
VRDGAGTSPHLRPSPGSGRSTQVRASPPLSRADRAERCCPSHSPTLRPWIAGRRRPSWRGFGARARGVLLQNVQAKANAFIPASYLQLSAARLSLSGGASIRSLSPSDVHHLCAIESVASERKKATLLGRPRESRYSASHLAHALLSEGGLGAVHVALRQRREPTRRADESSCPRQDPLGDCRFHSISARSIGAG